jgi:hypothetical protein
LFGSTRWEEGVRFGQARAFALAFAVATLLTQIRGINPVGTVFGILTVLWVVESVRSWKRGGR